MPFSFTFTVPGIANPFSSQSEHSPSNPPPAKPVNSASQEPFRRRRPSPASSFSPEVPLSRKRGWVPSLAEPSEAATFNASTSGYLDTPAKYREMASHDNDEHEREVEEMIAELPPAKRRRTLAGSIVSTALSAALIGTAVGLTVYRLWRDRGKESEQIPPPSYQEAVWVHQEPPKAIEVTPPTPKTRRQRPTSTIVKRPSVRHRRTRSRPHIHALTPPRSSSPARLTCIQPEFDLGPHDHPEEEGEDQMDWIGDKLAQLIEEGKKALGREVVVMSDAQEDEIDDGTGAWEEDEAGPSSTRPHSRAGSIRRAKPRPRDIALPPSYSAHPGLSPPPTSLSPGFIPSTPQRMGRGVSIDSDTFSNGGASFREDESTWASPELRESMERARARFLQNRR